MRYVLCANALGLLLVVGMLLSSPRRESGEQAPREDEVAPDPNRRIQQLINKSENLRQIELEWERFWLLDQPSHLAPQHD